MRPVGTPTARPTRAAAGEEDPSAVARLAASGSPGCVAAACRAANARGVGAAPPHRWASARRSARRSKSGGTRPDTATSCSARARRQASDTESSSEWRSRPREAAAATRKGGSGPPRASAQRTSGTSSASAPGPGPRASPARYQGPTGGGTRRRAIRCISISPASAITARRARGVSPRGPVGGP